MGNGKYMPDYSIVEKLCNVLSISLSELIDGKDSAENRIQAYDEQILDLISKIQELEREKSILYGMILIAIGVAGSVMSGSIGGSDLKDFISGSIMGLFVAEMLAGIYLIGIKLP